MRHWYFLGMFIIAKNLHSPHRHHNRLCITCIYAPLAVIFIKSFPHVTKMTVKLIIHLIMVMPFITPALFSPSLITLMKTHKSEKYTAYHCNTMHWGIPLNYPNMSQIQISTDIPVPQSSARVSENNTEGLSPCSPPHYPRFKR